VVFSVSFCYYNTPIFPISDMFRRSGGPPFLRLLVNLHPCPILPFLFTSSFMFVRECGADVDRCSVLFPSLLFYIAMAYGRGVRVCQCHITVTRNITGNIQHRASIFSIYVLNIVFSLSSIFPIGAKCHHVLLFAIYIYSRPSSSNLPQSWHAHLVFD
jgi:hypothetical protein